MKIYLKSAFVAATLSLAVTADAGQQTVSLGYAQSKLQDFKNLRGINAKYRYEWDSSLSVIGSLTYMTGKKDFHYGEEYYDGNGDVAYYSTDDVNTKAKYFSLSVGPAYRINKYISAYGLVGLNHAKIDKSETWQENSDTPRQLSTKSTSISAMYGVGFQINPVENIAIDIGYEASSLQFAGQNYAINGFNVGIGYRF